MLPCSEREPENDLSQSDAHMANDGDRHANEGDDECDRLNRTNHDHEPDSDNLNNMSNDDDDADRDVNDHNNKDDDDADDDGDEAVIGSDGPVCKSDTNRAGTLACQQWKFSGNWPRCASKPQMPRP
jgi:hypothetical protein